MIFPATLFIENKTLWTDCKEDERRSKKVTLLLYTDLILSIKNMFQL